MILIKSYLKIIFCFYSIIQNYVECKSLLFISRIVLQTHPKKYNGLNTPQIFQCNFGKLHLYVHQSVICMNWYLLQHYQELKKYTFVCLFNQYPVFGRILKLVGYPAQPYFKIQIMVSHQIIWYNLRNTKIWIFMVFWLTEQIIPEELYLPFRIRCSSSKGPSMIVKIVLLILNFV